MTTMTTPSRSPMLTVNATWDVLHKHAVKTTICIILSSEPGVSYSLFDTTHETVASAAIKNIRRIGPTADSSVTKEQGIRHLRKLQGQHDTPDTRAAKAFFDEFMQEEGNFGKRYISTSSTGSTRRLFPRRSASARERCRRAFAELLDDDGDDASIDAPITTTQVTLSKRSLSNERGELSKAAPQPIDETTNTRSYNQENQSEMHVKRFFEPSYLERRRSTPTIIAELIPTADTESVLQPQDSRFLQPRSPRSTSQSLQLRGSLTVAKRPRQRSVRKPWQSPIQKDYTLKSKSTCHFYRIVQALSEPSNSSNEGQTGAVVHNAAASEAKKRYVGPLHSMSANALNPGGGIEPGIAPKPPSTAQGNGTISADGIENDAPSEFSDSCCSDLSCVSSAIPALTRRSRLRSEFRIYEDKTAVGEEAIRDNLESFQSRRCSGAQSLPNSPKLWLRYRGSSSQYFLDNPLQPLKSPVNPICLEEKGVLTIHFPGDVTCGTYEVTLDIATFFTGQNPLGWQFFMLPGLLHLDAKLPTDSSYGAFAFSLKTLPDCTTLPEVQFDIGTLAECRINELGEVTGTFPLYCLLNLGLRVRRPLLIVDEFTSDIILRATPSQTTRNMVKVHYHLSLTANTGNQEVYAERFEFHFMIRNYVPTTMNSKEIDELELNFGKQEVRKLGVENGAVVFAVTRDQSNIKQSIDLCFALEYEMGNNLVMRMPNTRPVTGKVASEVILVTRPSLPLKLEHIAQKPLSSWRFSQGSENQIEILCFQRLEMPSCYPEALLDDLALKVTSLSPLRFHGFGKAVGSSVSEHSQNILKNIEMVLSEGEVPSLDCSVQLDVEVGTNPTILIMDPQGWEPIASYIDRQLATEELGEWRQIDGIHCGLYKTNEMKIGQIVHVEIFFRLRPDENDFKETKLRDRFSGNYSLPAVVGKTILGATLNFDFDDYFSICVAKSGEKQRIERKFESGSRGSMRLGRLPPEYDISISFEDDGGQSGETSLQTIELGRVLTLGPSFLEPTVDSPKKHGRALSCVLEENESQADDVETPTVTGLLHQEIVATLDPEDLESSWHSLDKAETDEVLDMEPLASSFESCESSESSESAKSSLEDLNTAAHVELQGMADEVEELPDALFLTRMFSRFILPLSIIVFLVFYREGTSCQDHVAFLQSYGQEDSTHIYYPFDLRQYFQPIMGKEGGMSWLEEYLKMTDPGETRWLERALDVEGYEEDEQLNHEEIRMTCAPFGVSCDPFLEDEADEQLNQEKEMRISCATYDVTCDFSLEGEAVERQQGIYIHGLQEGDDEHGEETDEEEYNENEDTEYDSVYLDNCEVGDLPPSSPTPPNEKSEAHVKKRPVLDWIDSLLGWKDDV